MLLQLSLYIFAYNNSFYIVKYYQEIIHEAKTLIRNMINLWHNIIINDQNSVNWLYLHKRNGIRLPNAQFTNTFQS